MRNQMTDFEILNRQLRAVTALASLAADKLCSTIDNSNSQIKEAILGDKNVCTQPAQLRKP